MGRDTQIGIILGVVILVIIGVFLSTRTSVKEPEMPGLIAPDEDISKIEEIDISELINEQKARKTEKITPEEDLTKRTPAELSAKNEAIIEGKWEGYKTEIVDTEIDKSEILVTEKELPEEAPETKKEIEIPVIRIQSEVVHKVVSNDNLFNLSKKYYGDEAKWIKIYEANKDNLPNPDTLYVGQELLIPDTSASEEEGEALPESEPDEETLTTGRTHIVRPGDTLYGLAKKYYNNTTMWKNIYDANKDIIESKSLLKVGQTLIIPDK
ncbi:MAG: LysM peptidoglycan-binding domain-containing protein [Candidatus Scalinduaceae bacterium]